MSLPAHTHTAPVFIALHRIGPYHHARFIAAARCGLSVIALQTRPNSLEYPWSFDPSGPFVVENICGSTNADADPPAHCLDQQISRLLNYYKPRVIVTVGWSDRTYHRLLIAARAHRIPLVLVSDSREKDEPRSALKEYIKTQLLMGFSSALVAGQESRSYLERLNFPSGAVFQPWDVVDNSFFATAALQSGHREKHFLCVSRFIAKKNHLGLLDAYSTYQNQGGIWGLRLVGSGPMLGAIQDKVRNLPYPSRVEIFPFSQLEDLGHIYGKASAFILPSITDQWGLVVNEAIAASLPCIVSSGCGCACDLITHGQTGWIFDPANTASLARFMHSAERQSSAARYEMVSKALIRLQLFSPDSFSSGLISAINYALKYPRFSLRSALFANALSLFL